ncbi:nuclear transport factor 2 family protein [Bdellovibrio sp. KM01]|uniref:nuclear transport factor 2 family protein n=1 Tax=Bdellovibrio sp. KM01 TaxID=2748865 RepID=UPI0015EA6FC0|nr:nuclear transport factor 2 family protein [Bdellovibrio sp. KM01]QLY25265.1 nuclear transport factor 2 family protein [Bdellovibrio sp. KM01]
MAEDSKLNAIEVVKQFYIALNGNNIPAALSLLDPQIVRVEFEGTPMGGTYRGLDEMRDHFSKGRSTWAEGSCTPEKVTAVGNAFVVDVHVKVRLKDKTDWIDGHVADAFAFRNGKITEFRSFEKSEDAMKWASHA